MFIKSKRLNFWDILRKDTLRIRNSQDILKERVTEEKQQVTEVTRLYDKKEWKV